MNVKFKTIFLELSVKDLLTNLIKILLFMGLSEVSEIDKRFCLKAEEKAEPYEMIISTSLASQLHRRTNCNFICFVNLERNLSHCAWLKATTTMQPRYLEVPGSILGCWVIFIILPAQLPNPQYCQVGLKQRCRDRRERLQLISNGKS